MATPEIKSCIATIGPNQVTEGFYTVENGILTMCMSNGREVGVSHRLRPDDNAHAIAVVLTKKIRAEMKGEKVPGFSRALEYPEHGLA